MAILNAGRLRRLRRSVRLPFPSTCSMTCYMACNLRCAKALPLRQLAPARPITSSALSASPHRHDRVRGWGTVYRDSHVERAEVWMYNRSIQRFECLPFVWKTRSALHVISNDFIFSGQVIKCLCADRSHYFKRVQRMALKRPTTDLGAEGRGFESRRSDHFPSH